MRKLVRRLAVAQVNLATLACSETAGAQHGSAQWQHQCLREMQYLQVLLAESQVSRLLWQPCCKEVARPAPCRRCHLTQAHLRRAAPVSRHQQLKVRLASLVDTSSDTTTSSSDALRGEFDGLSTVPQHIKAILQQSRTRRRRQRHSPENY